MLKGSQVLDEKKSLGFDPELEEAINEPDRTRGLSLLSLRLTRYLDIEDISIHTILDLIESVMNTAEREMPLADNNLIQIRNILFIIGVTDPIMGSDLPKDIQQRVDELRDRLKVLASNREN